MLCNWKSLIYTFNKQTPLHIKVEGVQVENDANMSLQTRLKLNFLKNLLYPRSLFLFLMRREIWNARSQKLTEFHCLDRFCCVDVQGHTWEYYEPSYAHCYDCSSDQRRVYIIEMFHATSGNIRFFVWKFNYSIWVSH